MDVAVGTRPPAAPSRAAQSARPIIEIAHLDKTFLTVRNERIHALSDISLNVAEREFVTVVGPSGCGKSTLLKILGGLIPATSGSVKLAGTKVDRPRRDIGIVFQNPVLLPWRTVIDNAMRPAEVQSLDRTAAAPAGARLAEDGRARRIRDQ